MYFKVKFSMIDRELRQGKGQEANKAFASGLRSKVNFSRKGRNKVGTKLNVHDDTKKKPTCCMQTVVIEKEVFFHNASS